MHRLASDHVVDDLLRRLPLPWREFERQHRRGRCAIRSSTVGTNGFRSVAALVTAPGVSELEQEELLEDQPPLRRRRNAFSVSTDRSLGGKCASSTACRRGISASRAQFLGQWIRNLRRELIQCHDQTPLHIRRHHPGLLVERHHAPVCRPDRSSVTSSHRRS